MSFSHIHNRMPDRPFHPGHLPTILWHRLPALSPPLLFLSSAYHILAFASCKRYPTSVRCASCVCWMSWDRGLSCWIWVCEACCLQPAYVGIYIHLYGSGILNLTWTIFFWLPVFWNGQKNAYLMLEMGFFQKKATVITCRSNWVSEPWTKPQLWPCLWIPWRLSDSVHFWSGHLHKIQIEFLSSYAVDFVFSFPIRAGTIYANAAAAAQARPAFWDYHKKLAPVASTCHSGECAAINHIKKGYSPAPWIWITNYNINTVIANPHIIFMIREWMMQGCLR